MSVNELREKLNLYLTNSGLSDSEIARRIGVNRVSVSYGDFWCMELRCNLLM